MDDGKGKERTEALSLFPFCPARYIFFDYCYFYWHTQREPLGRRDWGLDVSVDGLGILIFINSMDVFCEHITFVELVELTTVMRINASLL